MTSPAEPPAVRVPRNGERPTLATVGPGVRTLVSAALKMFAP
ncbi:hypothetical protein ACIOKD_32955 [Streptomyces sp. NPDC087844]